MKVIHTDQLNDTKIYSVFPAIMFIKQKKKRTVVLIIYRWMIVIYEKRF